MTELEKVAAEILKLSPPDRLRLAADLLDAQRPELAQDVARRVVEELGAALVLRKARRG